jgi:hypothetical protein
MKGVSGSKERVGRQHSRLEGTACQKRKEVEQHFYYATNRQTYRLVGANVEGGEPRDTSQGTLLFTSQIKI